MGLFLVLVQKLQDNCKYSLKLGHNDSIILKKCVIGMEKELLVQKNTVVVYTRTSDPPCISILLV
ncbi:hypothetical protein BW898_19765 [Bacillus cereus]|nr:hypothetical protein BW898_19765 [Bacillus cereus]